MSILHKTILCISLATIFQAPIVMANEIDQGDIYYSGYTPDLLQTVKDNLNSWSAESDFTVLDSAEYQKNVTHSRVKIQSILDALKSKNLTDANERIIFIGRQLLDIPYIFTGATGEGDWQTNSSIYKPGDVHVKQDPIYRLDGLDCQTFVQIAMGLMYSQDINEFDQHILKISYGAAGNSYGGIHYYNRNNFIDGDWNPVNHQNGWLIDVTSQGDLSEHAAMTYATITRQNWFSFQQKELANNIRVLSRVDGPSMVKRFTTVYSTLNYPHFDSEVVPTSYIPKEKLAIQQLDGSYHPNTELFDLIPTPAVIEIVRDVKKWTIGDKNIKDIIGSELSISHMGLLYRQDFKYGDFIYYKTTCDYDDQQQKSCNVTPVVCQKDTCNELMFIHATDARPSGYYWYQQFDGNYTCSSKLPEDDNISFTQCNRVVQQPLFDYLTDYQYGSYTYMNKPSLIGIHIEKLN